MRELKKDLIQRLMISVPDSLPEDVDDFVKECFAQHEHIFYDKKKKKAYCTFCQKDIPKRYQTWTDGVHNAEGRCPVCKRDIVYKCIGRMRDKRPIYWRVRVPAGTLYAINVLVLQKVAEEYFVLRRFSLTKVTLAHCCQTEVSWEENQRVFFNGIKKHSVINAYGGWKESTKSRWCDNDKWNRYITPFGEFDFMGNVDEITQGTFLQYAVPFYEQIMTVSKYNRPWEYTGSSCDNWGSSKLQFYANWRRPMEYLFKAGFNDLARDMLSNGNIITGKETSLAQILGVSKQYFPLVKELPYGFYGVRKLRQMIKEGHTNIDKNAFHIYLNANAAVKDYRTFVPDISKLQCIQYLRKQCRKAEWNIVSHEYKDYLRWCNAMGYDMTVADILFPENLKEAHDRECKRYTEFTTAQNQKRYLNIHARYQKEHAQNEWQKNGLIIRMVRDYAELFNEGAALGHCVGTYTTSVSTGRTTILVIRKEEAPDTPYVTLEYQNNRVIQYHGYKNDRYTPMPEEVKAFVEEWEKEMKRREDRRKRKEKQAVINKVAV